MYHKVLFFLILKRALMAVLFVTLVVNVYGQESKAIDSLKEVIKRSNRGDRQGPYQLLGLEYFGKNDKLAIAYEDSSYTLAVSKGDSLQIARTGRIMAHMMYSMGLIDSSLTLSLTVLPIAERIHSKKEIKRISNLLALGYTWKANFDEALRYNFQSLEIREAEGNKPEMSTSYLNIALVYFKLEDYERSLQYYKKALHLKNEAHDTHDLDRLLINMGNCYNQMKDYKEGLNSINEGLKVCGGGCNKSVQLEGQYGLGIALKETGKLEEAIGYFDKASVIANEIGEVRFQLEILKSLAKINMRLNNDVLAEKQLMDAEKMAKGTSYNQILIEIYRDLSLLYIQRKDLEKTVFYQDKYIVLKDSIFSKTLIKNLTTIQNNYEQRVNLKTIADRDTVLALKDETLRRQESEAMFYVIVAALVFVLAGLMFLLFRLTQRANALLEVRVEQRTRELNNSNEALAKVNGELDNFIYKTSHDIRGPLASLKGICNVAIMDVRDEAALGYLQKLDFTAEKLNRILTRLLIINQINHAVLASNVIIFEELLEDILFLERKKGIPKRLKIFYEIEKGFILKSDKEMLRIVLENLIDNSIKFYNESDRVDPFVKVFVYAVEGDVMIKVIDNGVGINAETKEKIFQMFVRASERSETGGIGLYLSRLATGRIEGKIDFRTTPEKYTEFSIKLPMDLAPILAERAEADRIRQFEKIRQVEKLGRFSLS